MTVYKTYDGKPVDGFIQVQTNTQNTIDYGLRVEDLYVRAYVMLMLLKVTIMFYIMHPYKTLGRSKSSQSLLP